MDPLDLPHDRHSYERSQPIHQLGTMESVAHFLFGHRRHLHHARDLVAAISGSPAGDSFSKEQIMTRESVNTVTVVFLWLTVIVTNVDLLLVQHRLTALRHRLANHTSDTIPMGCDH